MTGITANQLNELFVSDDGAIYVGGLTLSAAGTVTLLGVVAIWTGTGWLPFPITGPECEEILIVGANQVLVSVGSGAGTRYYPDLTTVENEGEASAYPEIRFRRNGTGNATIHYLSNETVGAHLYFNSLALAPGEIITLDLTPGAISFFSNTRGNLLSYILPGSNLAGFRLAPGDNHINCLIESSSGTDEVAMHWREQHWGFQASI